MGQTGEANPDHSGFKATRMPSCMSLSYVLRLLKAETDSQIFLSLFFLIACVLRILRRFRECLPIGTCMMLFSGLFHGYTSWTGRPPKKVLSSSHHIQAHTIQMAYQYLYGKLDHPVAMIVRSLLCKVTLFHHSKLSRFATQKNTTLRTFSFISCSSQI